MSTPCPTLPEPLGKALGERVADQAYELPLLPEVTSQVTAESSKEDWDARKLAELVKRDPSMAAHVLRMANSPLYRGSTPIVSLQQAITRMGAQVVRQMALTIACEGKIFRVKGFEADVRALFRHSLATALYAQEIARTCRLNVEEAFLAGLLHDVGTALLLQLLVDLERTTKCALPHADAVQAAEHYHAEVGSNLAKRWSFPERLSAVLLHHHSPEPPAECEKQVMVIQLADTLAHRLLDAPSQNANDGDASLRSHAALAALDIYPDALEALLQKSAALTQALQAWA